MGSQAGFWLIILTVAVAVGIGFSLPVLVELRRSAKRLTSVLTIAEQSLDPLLRDLNATVQRLDRVTGEIGAVADDVHALTGSVRRVGRSVGELSLVAPAAILGFGAGRAAQGAGIVTDLTYLARRLFRTREKKSAMSSCESSPRRRTVVVSLLVGAIAGVAAVLLLAPKARREPAARIRELPHRT